LQCPCSCSLSGTSPPPSPKSYPNSPVSRPFRPQIRIRILFCLCLRMPQEIVVPVLWFNVRPITPSPSPKLYVHSPISHPCVLKFTILTLLGPCLRVPEGIVGPSLWVHVGRINPLPPQTHTQTRPLFNRFVRNYISTFSYVYV
jgi:hypothetical protein